MQRMRFLARPPRRSSQGRKRQEGLVVKMLRVALTDAQLKKLLVSAAWGTESACVSVRCSTCVHALSAAPMRCAGRGLQCGAGSRAGPAA